MSYTTIYETSQHSQIVLFRNIFEQNNVRYKILDETTNTNFPIGVRVQVFSGDFKRAEGLLKENGFLTDPIQDQNSISKSKFWLWFIIAIVCLVIAAFLINMLMKG